MILPATPICETYIHRLCGEALVYSCSIGGTHWDHLGGAEALPGPRPTLFLRPEPGQKARWQMGSGWIAGTAGRRVGALHRSGDIGPMRWLTVVTSSGQAAISKAVADVMRGRVPPE